MHAIFFTSFVGGDEIGVVRDISGASVDGFAADIEIDRVACICFLIGIRHLISSVFEAKRLQIENVILQLNHTGLHAVQSISLTCDSLHLRVEISAGGTHGFEVRHRGIIFGSKIVGVGIEVYFLDKELVG